jgi:hypothetical protein
VSAYVIAEIDVENPELVILEFENLDAARAVEGA